MLRLADRLFRELNATGIDYCHWKSNIRLHDSLEGKTDLDLLLRSEQAGEFGDMIDRLGFKLVISEPWKKYPSIVDYMGLDNDSAKFLHLHVHYRLILGRRLLKEYHVPWEEILLTGDQRISGVRIPSPEAELLIHIVRMAVKRDVFPVRSLVKRLLRKSGDSSDDFDELQWLVKRSNVSELRKLLHTLGLDGSLGGGVCQVASNPAKANKRALRLIKGSIRSYRRFGPLEGCILMAKRRSLQVRSLVRQDHGKKVGGGGGAVAVLGTDGSGKTTLCRLLRERLGWKLRVKSYYLGSSRYSPITFIAVMFSVPFRILEKMFPKAFSDSIPAMFYRTLLEISYANDRVRRFRKGVKAACSGAVVIFERFPLPGVVDWPLWLERDNPAVRSGLFRAARRLLDDMYAQLEYPRLFIFLDLPQQIAVQRKPDHPPEMIAAKKERLATLFKKVELAPVVFRIDATQTPEQITKKVMKRIWERI